MRFKNLERKPERESSKKTISTRGKFSFVVAFLGKEDMISYPLHYYSHNMFVSIDQVLVSLIKKVIAWKPGRDIL